jgi:hypothetical protein
MPPRKSTPGVRAETGRERRTNAELRELLDEMIVHVRDLARRAAELNAPELEYAQERLEWLADEIWDTVIRLREQSGGGKKR